MRNTQGYICGWDLVQQERNQLRKQEGEGIMADTKSWEHKKGWVRWLVLRNRPQMKAQMDNHCYRTGEGRRVWGTFLDYISMSAPQIYISFARSYTTLPISVAVRINHGLPSFVWCCEVVQPTCRWLLRPSSSEISLWDSTFVIYFICINTF